MKICPVCSTEYTDDVKFCPNDGQTLRAATPAHDLVGQVVADRYHVVKKLGEGGMGQVYLAEHVKMGRRSAIKVMNPSMVHDPDAVARFNREASNASRITHPNVCAIYDFGETPDGLIYLAMEFIEGEPLTDLLEREGGGALPLARAADIFHLTADALQAAHDLGIVHRDLKPDNIMLTRRKGGGDTIKVVDFGIAKAVGGDESGQKVTKTGLVIGTPSSEPRAAVGRHARRAQRSLLAGAGAVSHADGQAAVRGDHGAGNDDQAPDRRAHEAR
jgi:serine/threonine-protein kinase